MKYKTLFLCLCLAGSAWVVYRLTNPSTPVFAEVVSGYPECHNCIPIPSEATVLLFHDNVVETKEAVTELLKKVNPIYDEAQVSDLDIISLVDQALDQGGLAMKNHLKMEHGYQNIFTPDEMGVRILIEYDTLTLQERIDDVSGEQHITSTSTTQTKTGSGNMVSTRLGRRTKHATTTNSRVTTVSNSTTLKVRSYVYEAIVHPKITVTYTYLGLFGRSEGDKTFTKILEPVKSTFFTRVKL